jgi:hypothetical protein
LPLRNVRPLNVTPALCPTETTRIPLAAEDWRNVVFAPAPVIVILVALVGTVRAPSEVVSV